MDAFLGLSAALAIAANLVVRRVSLATALAVVASVLANLAHETWLRPGQLRPDDIVLWIPVLMVGSGFVALGVAGVVAYPALILKLPLAMRRIQRQQPELDRAKVFRRALARTL